MLKNAPPLRGVPALRGGAFSIGFGASLGVKRYWAALMFWMCVHVPVMDPGKT